MPQLTKVGPGGFLSALFVFLQLSFIHRSKRIRERSVFTPEGTNSPEKKRKIIPSSKSFLSNTNGTISPLQPPSFAILLLSPSTLSPGTNPTVSSSPVSILTQIHPRSFRGTSREGGRHTVKRRRCGLCGPRCVVSGRRSSSWVEGNRFWGVAQADLL